MGLKNGSNGGNRNAIVVFSIIAILCLSATAGADIIEFPLNCAGTYDVNTPVWRYNFDLGVMFSEISRVYIDWSGEIYGGLLGMVGRPDTDTIPIDGSLYAQFSYPPMRTAIVSRGDSTYPNPEPFDIRSEFLPSGTSRWNDLLDGMGTISIYYPKRDPWIPEFFVIDYGSAVLNNSMLVIEGTVIPEPSTLLLFSVGMFGIWIKRNRKK